MNNPREDEPPVIVVQTGRASAPAEVEAGQEDSPEVVEQPAKVMRIGSMIRQLLEEVRQAPLDDASRARLRENLRHLPRRAAGGPVGGPQRGADPYGAAVPPGERAH